MRTLLAALLLTSLALPSAFGQANSAPPRPVPSPTPAPAGTTQKPAQSRSLLQRIFGPRATPTPVPAPTPAPVVKRRPKPKPTPSETAETPAKVTPKVTPKETTPGTEPSATTTAVKPKAGKGTPKKGAAVPANTAALDDATKFKNAKAKALEDAHIRELKARADGEVNEAEAHKALVNYNRALFEKIREVDPSVGDYAGKVEQAMAKRLGAEKTKE